MATNDETGAYDTLDHVLAEYLQALEAGTAPPRAELLARHPDLAARLQAFFADLDAVGGDVSKFRLPDPQLTVSVGHDVTGGGHERTALPRVRYLGDYELTSEIARGGMGVVYQARQATLNRVVALKMILAGNYATEQAVQRFRAEAEAAAGLDHPNILPIYEVGEHEGHQYFSMKYVEGGSLSAKLDELRTQPKHAAQLIATLARAVQFAHQRGILHRDLKPANVLLDADGTPFITDFGLAKKVDADDGSTRTGAVVGTPSYMAPEQARGEKGLTTAVDVYSLGAILYELLTGRPPFKGETVFETIKQVIEREAPDPRTINTHADRDLSTIALKCLQKEPSHRYADAGAFADDLERYGRGEPISARPVSQWERARKWVQRNPAIATLATTIFVVLVTGLAASSWFAWKAHQEANAARDAEHDAEANFQQASTNLALAQQAQAQSEKNLRQSIFEQARAERLAGNPQRSLELLTNLASPEPNDELRTELAEAVYRFGMRLVAKTAGRSTVDYAGPYELLHFSADSSLLATTDTVQSKSSPNNNSEPIHGVRVYDVATGQSLAEIDCTTNTGFAFHPHQPVLAITRREQICLWEPRTGQMRTLGEGRGPLHFSPDGNYLAAVNQSGHACVCSLADGQNRPTNVKGQPLRITNEGHVYIRDQGTLRRWDIKQQAELPTIRNDQRVLAVDQAGRFALFRRAEKGVAQLGIADLQREAWVTSGIAAADRTDAGVFTFSPTAPIVAINTTERERAYELYHTETGERLTTLSIPNKGPVTRLKARFRGDGSILAIQDDDQGETHFCEVGTGRLLQTLPKHDSATWSPDGRYLAAFCAVGSAKIGETGNRTRGRGSYIRIYEVPPIPTRYALRWPVRSLCFTPDGRQLVAGQHMFGLASHREQQRVITQIQSTPDQRPALASRTHMWSVPLKETLALDAPISLQPWHTKEAVLLPARANLKTINAPNAGEYRQVAFSPDEKALAMIWSGWKADPQNQGIRLRRFEIEVWDIAQRQKRHSFNRLGSAVIHSMAFHPTEPWLFATAGSVEIWNLHTGEQLALSVANPSPPLWLVPVDNDRLAAGFANGHVGCYRLVSVHGIDNQQKKITRYRPELINNVPTHEGDVTALAYCETRQWLASGGEDGTISLRDGNTLQLLARWTAGSVPVSSLAFAPDGRELVSSDEQGLVQCWHLPALTKALQTITSPERR